MLVTDDGMVMLVNSVQYANACHPILVTDDGITLVFMPITNVSLLMLITQFSSLLNTVFPLATSILVNPVQPENAYPPILATDDGIVMLVNPVQKANACPPILVKLLSLSNVILANPVQ